MLLHALAPLLLCNTLGAATPAAAPALDQDGQHAAQLEQVKRKQKRAFEDEELDDDEDAARGVKRRVNPDGAAVAYLKACGLMCLTGCGVWLAASLLAIIPGVGWLGSIVLQVANPAITATVGWFVLQKWSQRRAPLGAMILGVGVPFWGVLTVNLILSVLLGIAVPIVAVLATIGATLFILSSTDSNSLLLGVLGSYAVLLVPTLLVGLVAAVGTLFLLGALGGGTLLSSALGVLLGRGQVEGESSINLDVFSVDDPEDAAANPKDRRRRNRDDGDDTGRRRRRDPEDDKVEKAQPEGGEEVVPKQDPPAAEETPGASPVVPDAPAPTPAPAPAPGPVLPPSDPAAPY